jgi:FMN-dependent NADH-azoreductase
MNFNNAKKDSNMPEGQSILRVDSSARIDGSVSRGLTDKLIAQLRNAMPDARILLRDVALGSVPHVNPAWVSANTTPADIRSADQREALAVSDSLVAEVQAADILVIGCPIYNFSVPASLKAWIDQICRAGLTFQYSPQGPIGLLKDKMAYVIITSGGTEMDGPVDFATSYMRHVLSFIGITNVTVIASDRLMIDADAAQARAHAAIDGV